MRRRSICVCLVSQSLHSLTHTHQHATIFDHEGLAALHIAPARENGAHPQLMTIANFEWAQWKNAKLSPRNEKVTMPNCFNLSQGPARARSDTYMDTCFAVTPSLYDFPTSEMHPCAMPPQGMLVCKNRIELFKFPDRRKVGRYAALRCQGRGRRTRTMSP